jgi:DNA-binding response OmpR family regulator
MSGEHILIVEDERAVARSLEYALTREGYSVLWADTGQRALDLAHTQEPHIILLDLRLPDISGFDICRQLRAEGYRQPILILTAMDDQLDKVLGLELGADDYVVKPYEMRELIARLRAMLRRAYGELALAGRGKHILFGDIEIDLEQLQVTHRSQPVSLTSTEFRLLVHLTSYPNRPFTRSELLEAVWGYDSSLGSERSVDVHNRHLREKLEDDPAVPRWIVTVRGVGYKFQT